jgi:hypothetical protein
VQNTHQIKFQLLIVGRQESRIFLIVSQCSSGCAKERQADHQEQEEIRKECGSGKIGTRLYMQPFYVCDVVISVLLSRGKYMDDLNQHLMKLQEEVAALLQERLKLQERVEELTPKVKFTAILRPGKPLYWIAE